MAKVLVLYYSRSGNTARMAELVAEGAKESGADVSLKAVGDVTAADLPNYDAIIIGTPTYYGQMCWEIKKLLDESVKFHHKLEGKVGGAFTSSANIGGGNETAILSILQAMLIHGMVVQGSSGGDHYGPVAIGAPDDRSAKGCIALGKRVAALAEKLSG
jgi:NAD(P)H dehydrogenase (quinone)